MFTGIESLENVPIKWAPQAGFNLMGQLLSFFDRPLRQYACVDKGERIFVIEEPLLTDPCEKLITIRCFKDRLQGIFRANRDNALRNGKEEQVMVAQHDNRSVFQILDIAEDRKRIRPTVDQIADEPETVDSRVKPNILNKPL